MARADVDLAAGEIVVRGDWREKDLLKAIPGATYKAGEDAWRAPLSWGVAWAIRGIFGPGVDISPDLAAWAGRKRERVDWVLAVRDQRDLQLDLLNGDGPEGMNPRLTPLQRVGAGFMAGAGSALLADGMGAGKTAQALEAIRVLHDRGDEMFPLLVVCPNSMKYTWRDEAAKWYPGLNLLVAPSGAAAVRKAIDQVRDGNEWDGLIINWEAARRHSRLAGYGSVRLKRCRKCGGRDDAVKDTDCEVHEGPLNAVPWRTVVADEAHRAKDPHSKNARAVWAIGRQETVGHRFALTGTPIETAPDELWPQLHFVSPADWPRRTQFIDRYCATAWSPFGVNVVGLRAETREEFYRVADTMLLRRPKEAVIAGLPPKIASTRWVDLGAKQRRAYEELKDNYATMIDGEPLLAFNDLSLHTRLSQLASAWGVVDEAGGLRLALPSAKADALVEMAHEAAGQPMVVFAESRQLIEIAAAKLKQAGVRHGLVTGARTAEERAVTVNEFQQGLLPVILLTFGAGAEGLTLTAAPTLVFLQRAWSSILNRQAEDRIHRPGAEKHGSLSIVDIVARDTIDERRLEVLDDKLETSEDTFRDRETILRLLG